MSECKYGIKNGDKIIGTIWDTKMGQIIVTTGEKIDLINPIEIRSVNGEDINNVDLLEFLYECLPFDKNSNLNKRIK